MSIRSRALVALVLATTAQSCAWVQLPDGWPMMSEPTGRPVALVPEPPPFTPPVRALTARALEEEIDRPVRVLDAMPTASDEETRALAERVVGRRSLRYDWREPHCTWDRTLLAGVTLDVDAVYRVAVEYSERERMATDAEWEELNASRLPFRRLAERPRVRQEFATGTITRSSLVTKDAVARASLHRRRVTLATDKERIDVAAAVADAVRGLDAAPNPDWEGLARRQLKQGCPFLALAIADTKLAPGPEEAVQTAALAAMLGPGDRGRHRAADVGPTRKPAPPLPVADVADGPGPAPAAPDAIAAAPTPVAASCRSLCAMHMVEICNTDKLLWSAHRMQWEPTPCGTRRDERFLSQCYQEQWDTGTFETSCVQPCEASDDGRSRLTAILQDAGCPTGSGPS